MRILHAHIITGIAGSESYLLKTLPALMQQGVEVEFLCIYRQFNSADTHAFTEKLKKYGIVIHYLPIGWLSYLLVIPRLHRIISKGKYDLVHTHLIHADVTLAVYKKLINQRIKLVSTKHGYEESYTVGPKLKAKILPSNLYYRLAVFAEKQMSKSYAISKSLKELYVWLKIAQPEKMEVINYGFDFPVSIDLKDVLPRSKVNLVIVGRLEKTKGHVYAIRALKQIVEKHPNVLLTLVGVGSYEQEIRKEVHSLELDAFVDFKGYMPNGIEFMHAADIVLVPSVREGFGIVVLEAFSQQKPILVFDVPAVNEIVVDTFSGYIIPAFSVDKFAKKLDDLINSPALRAELGSNGFDTWKKHYALDKMLNNTVSFYQRILSKNTKHKKVAIFSISLFGGGTEKICRLLANELPKKVETHIILLSKNEKKPIKTDGHLHFLTNEEKMGYFLKFALIPVLAFRLAHYLKRNEITAVLSMLNRPNYILVLAKLLFYPKLEVFISERTYTGQQYSGFNIIDVISKWMILKLYPLSDGIIVNSKAIRSHLVDDFKISEDKIKIIHNGVAANNEPTMKHSEQLNMLTVGRLDQNKNHKFLLQALQSAKIIQKLHLVGDGPELKNLRSYVAKNGLENRVVFEGFVPEPFTYFQKPQLFVLPSVHEGFPNVLLEALASGLMVISSDCLSGPREILSPDSNPSNILAKGFEVTKYGILYAVNDNNALVEAINYVANNPNSIEEIRINARERALFFDEKNMLERYESALL